MKFTINTAKLQEMVAKSVKGASNNRMIPITSLMAIELKEGRLVLTTTDVVNTLKIGTKDIEGEDGGIVIPVEMFSKLVSKLTKETTSVEVKESYVEIISNGKYTIEIPLDEEGQLIQYPEQTIEEGKDYTIKTKDIKQIIATNKAALAETLEQPFLTGYYISDTVVTTDTFKVCSTAINVVEQDLLIPAELMQLLDIIDTETIRMKYNNGAMLFTAPGIEIYGVELDDKELYPLEAIEGFLTTSFTAMGVLDKEAVTKVLDRLSLFVSPYDKNGVYLTFKKNELVFSSKEKSSTESIPMATENFEPYTCCIDIELLQSQITALQEPKIEMWYGDEVAVKLVGGDTTQIIALLEDDRVNVDEE